MDEAPRNLADGCKLEAVGVSAGEVELYLALGWQLTAPIGESVGMTPPPEFRARRDD